MTPISFEFYPPKTDEQRAQLDRTAARLKALSPEYVSCTFGAGGSTLDYTPETVERLHATHGLAAAPHVSCVGGSRAALSALMGGHKKIRSEEHTAGEREVRTCKFWEDACIEK